MSLYRNQLEDWLKTQEINVPRALDLGGASNPVKKRLKSYNVEEWVYLDNGAEEAKESYIHFDINRPLLEQQQESGYPVDFFKFDAVFCLEVFEYVWNPVVAMQNIFDLMSNDSVAVVSFPAIYPVHNPVEIDYLRYTKKAIEKYSELVGFSKIEIYPRIATEGLRELQAFYRVEGMHPVRHSELPFHIGYILKAQKLNYGEQ